jgi:hypothetical protein
VIHLSLDTNEQNSSRVPQILNLLFQFSLYFIKQRFFCKFLKIEIYFFSLNGIMFIITTFIYICISNTLIRHFKGTFKFYYTQLYIFFYDDVCFVLDQHVQLDYLVTNPMISHEWGKDRKLFKTSEKYWWVRVPVKRKTIKLLFAASFVYQILWYDTSKAHLSFTTHSFTFSFMMMSALC